MNNNRTQNSEFIKVPNSLFWDNSLTVRDKVNMIAELAQDRLMQNMIEPKETIEF